MPPRVTYWTGIWQPHREALSKQVAALRAALCPDAPVVSLSEGQQSAWRREDGVLRLGTRSQLLVRALAPLIERQGAITHVLGSIDAWHFIRALGRRPMVLTVALPGPALPLHFYDRVRVFAVETDVLANVLQEAGVTPDRIEIIPPGINLQQFYDSPPPGGPFRILFASTPANPREFDIRGIPLLIEVARACPDVEMVLLWRQWGALEEAERQFQLLNPPPNVIVDRRDVTDMAAVYRSAHATVCYFEPHYGKSAPNSIIEGLACGRPALLSEGCGLASIVRRAEAGIVSARNVEALVHGVKRLRDNYARHATNARALAESHFDEVRIIERYAAIYQRLTETRRRA
jgi:glycosyltransferase involved in cell wall biosynthesis